MDFNVDDLKKLSPAKKALIVLVFCLLLGYLYYMYFLQDIISRQITLRSKLSDMQTQIEIKEKAAAQIVQYTKEVNELQKNFNTALLKLPNQREIAGLLAAVVQSGKQTGVNFLLFEPKLPQPAAPVSQAPAPAKPDQKGAGVKPAGPQKFYDDIPIKVSLSGTFHDTVTFFAKVGQLPRIVNIEDISIGEAKSTNGRQMKVTTSCTMKTYMFVNRGRQ